MKRLVLAFFTGSTLLLSCRKEALPVDRAAEKAITAAPASQRMRMNCEPFSFGLLALADGNMSTQNMHIDGDMGLSQNAASNLNTNLLLDGSFFVHSNAGNLVYALSALASGILTQTDPGADWKISQANENANFLSALYASLTPNVSYNTLNNNTTVSTNATTEKPNTILNVTNMNLNGKVLTLVGRVSSDDGFIINVMGNFSFQNSEVKLVNVRPERVLFNFPNASSTIQVKAGSKFRGTILSPKGNVDYQSPTLYEGSIVAKTVNASANLLTIANPTFIQKTYCNGYQWEGDNECVPTQAEVPLIAGQSIDAGTVKVSNDGANLTVEYNTSGGWKMTQVHLYVGALENVPLSGGTNPVPGQFPINITFSQAVSNYTATIPLSGLPDCFVVAAHAALKKGNQVETGWGQGSQFTGSNWGMFFSYCKVTCM